MKIPFEKLTNHVQQALNLSVAEAVRNKLPAVTPEVLLLCLLEQKDSAASRLIPSTQSGALRNHINLKKSQATVTHPPISAQTTLILEEAALITLEFGTPFVSTEHVMLAMIRNSECDLLALLSLEDLAVKEMETTIINHMMQIGDLWEQDQEAGAKQDSLNIPSTSGFDEFELPERGSLLKRYAKDLTATNCGLSPVIGREVEIQRLSEILCRKTKNNPLLIGDAGVGKTAIVEGLAQMITSGKAPAALMDKKIYSLDISALVAGTMFRGEFESRLKDMLAELKKDSEAIMFIDEIHTIMGAGATHGSLDLANILKPALARGEIRCIGATTYAEFNKHIKSDAALERRFQTISVDEPTAEQTLAILKGLKNFYTSFHGINASQEILEDIISLTNRHLPHRKFPDKAVDVLDEACAKVKLRQPMSKSSREIQQLDKQIQRTIELKERAIFFENLIQAEKFSSRIEDLKIRYGKLKQNQKKLKYLPALKSEDILTVIAKQMNIEPQYLQTQDKLSPSTIAKRLELSLSGQTEAINQISELLAKAHLGLHSDIKPLASMMLIGSTGVGKTFTAKCVAKEFFGTDQALLKIDMADFQERHHISKLTGAPAGYVGYREESIFHQLLKRPNSVVLFDEVDKAHPDVMHVLLNILDNGLLTDASGQLISFRHSIIILTANQPLSGAIGFEKQTAGRESIQKILRKELIHRLDRVITFENLNIETLRNIASQSMATLADRLKKRNIQITWQPSLVAELAQQSQTEGGVRALQTLIDQQVMSQVFKKIGSGKNSQKIALISIKDQVIS